VIFFFSSRRQHTRFSRDWSSDVCSSDLIYGIGNPVEFGKNVIHLQVGDRIPRNQLLFKLVDILYSRTNVDLTRGTFRVKGDTVRSEERRVGKERKSRE